MRINRILVFLQFFLAKKFKVNQAKRKEKLYVIKSLFAIYCVKFEQKIKRTIVTRNRFTEVER